MANADAVRERGLPVRQLVRVLALSSGRKREPVGPTGVVLLGPKLEIGFAGAWWLLASGRPASGDRWWSKKQKT